MRNASLAAAVGCLSIAALSPLAAQTPPPDANAPPPSSAAEANIQAGTGQPAVTTVRSAQPGEPDTIVTTYPGNLKPPPPASFSKTYPVCRGALQDNCQNPGEGGAPGRSRAVDRPRP